MTWKPLIILAAIGAFAGPGDDPLAAAERLFDQGRLDEAGALFEKLAADNHPQADFFLGKIKFARQDWDAAIDHFKVAAAAENGNADRHFWLGKATLEKLKTAGFMERGILAGRVLDRLKMAIQLDPGHIEAREALAHYYFNAPPIAGGGKRKALAQAQEIAKLDPARGHLLAASFHRRKKDYERALDACRAYLDASADKTDGHYQLGAVYQAMARHGEAIDAFEEVLKRQPDHLAARYQLGRASALSGLGLARGAECLTAYLGSEPGPGLPSKAAAHWRLAMVYRHQGKEDQARRHLDTAIALEPDETSFQKTRDDWTRQDR